MEPYPSADDLDDMALSRSTSSIPPSLDERAARTERRDAQRRVAPGTVPMLQASELPTGNQEERFNLSVYDIPTGCQRTSAPTPMHAAAPKSPTAPSFHRKPSYASDRRPSSRSSPGYSLYPASKPPPATKPLPPLPPLPLLPALARSNPDRASLQASLDSSDAASVEASSRYSRSSRGSTLERVPTSSSTGPQTPVSASPPPPAPSVQSSAQPARNSFALDIVPWKQLESNDKPGKDPSVFFFDISTTSATLASKHGNNIIKVWSVGSGEVQNIKISCYTTAQPRSREYFVRSHAILSEPSNLIAVAAGFGDSLEIWDWGKRKRLQTIDNAHRWAAVRSNVMEAGWCPLATYRGDSDCIDLYAATHAKKPFKKFRTIELRKAGLPLMPKFPELAFSATGPLLVAASGPRPPRLGHPPPERETLLVAWEIHDGAPADAPYKVVAPWQHTELDTALPAGLATYGSVAVSLWIPASYRAIPIPEWRAAAAAAAANKTGGYNLAPVPAPYRHVLVWDFSVNSTTTFRIPNAASCISPDCRFVAYCDARAVETGARGCLALLDAMTGRVLWCWPDPDAGLMESGPGACTRPGFEQLGDLSRVTEMCFSADGGFLFVGDSAGAIGVFEGRGGVGQRAAQEGGVLGEEVELGEEGDGQVQGLQVRMMVLLRVWWRRAGVPYQEAASGRCGGVQGTVMVVAGSAGAAGGLPWSSSVSGKVRRLRRGMGSSSLGRLVVLALRWRRGASESSASWSMDMTWVLSSMLTFFGESGPVSIVSVVSDE
ncbi:hypothetical protein BT67DRAFT_434641 [Trichocladium antarcticum]|uniref:WD40 repeat-like protein n=1 Tax=Trichocladium antarcticum TaxID=1450529 RepID=A0AAN6ZDB3_9PEZI|nr:hypothetical protein BT67DRAFT_434641 [Trichocladium antarcticum]